jgi:hypothetical protein
MFGNKDPINNWLYNSQALRKDVVRERYQYKEKNCWVDISVYGYKTLVDINNVFKVRKKKRSVSLQVIDEKKKRQVSLLVSDNKKRRKVSIEIDSPWDGFKE